MIKISRFRAFIRKHQKSAPVVFFILGFTWDSLTLGSIDRLYDQIIICVYLLSLSLSLYLFNLADDNKWKETFLERYEDYFPLAIQFFIGGLCSAYVIFFSRSVSFTKTVSFFIILVVLLFANELLKKRISNKYLQFGTYFFVNFTFFTFFIPVLVNTMNTFIFLISGGISLSSTLILVTFIYGKSPSTRRELNKTKLLLQKILKKLKPNDREILKLYYTGKVEYKDIAKELGIPLGTVMSRLFYAKKNAAKVIKRLKYRL